MVPVGLVWRKNINFFENNDVGLVIFIYFGSYKEKINDKDETNPYLIADDFWFNVDDCCCLCVTGICCSVF